MYPDRHSGKPGPSRPAGASSMSRPACSATTGSRRSPPPAQCAAAGVNGALYHHFANMTEVMEAVFGDIEGQLVDCVVAGLSGVEPARLSSPHSGPVIPTPRRRRSHHPDRVRRSAVRLGWSRWRSLDGGRSLTLIADILRRCADDGDLRDDVDPLLSAQLPWALNEAGMYIGTHHTTHAPSPTNSPS